MNRRPSSGRARHVLGVAAVAILLHAAPSGAQPHSAQTHSAQTHSAQPGSAQTASAQTGSAQTNPIVGTWTLTAADVIKADGTRTEDYGPSPHGLAIFTADGRYMIEIYRVARARFASGDKLRGTPDEYKDVSLGNSCHFGTYAVDGAKGTIAFTIDSASFTNWDGTTQVRAFTLEGDTLTWRVPPRPDGAIPVSSFRRVGAS
jgi:hypothetical protein